MSQAGRDGSACAARNSLQQAHSEPPPLFQGYLSELKIYSNDLTQELVEEDMCNGQPSWDCRGLIGKYTFDDHTTSDHSGAAWHGRLYIDEQDSSTLFTKRKGENAIRFTSQVCGSGLRGVVDAW